MIDARVPAEVSPWLKYEARLNEGTFDSLRLQQITLSLYNGYQWPLDLSQAVYALDDADFKVAMAMLNWYRRFGETCPFFLNAGRSFAEQRLNKVEGA